MIEEILPGLVQWSAFHEGIGHVVHSSFDLHSGTLIDPMEPQEGLEALATLATPQRIVLTNRHHYRHSARYVNRFGCPVLCHKAGLAHFGGDRPVRGGDRPVRGFSFDEQLADGVRALELGSICAEETTLLLNAHNGALTFGDGLTRDAKGSLTFMPDALLGEDPTSVRRGLLRNLRRTLEEEDFDSLLFAHSEPVISGAAALLDDLLSQASAIRMR
jgi:hypothetical protein